MSRFNCIFSLLLSLPLFLIPNTSVFARGGAGSTFGAFLKLPSGARAIGMGETYVAVGDDVQAMSWNPAGLARMEQKQFTFMHAEWFEGVRHESAAYAQPLGGFIFLGGGVDFISSGQIIKTSFDSSSGLTQGPDQTLFTRDGTFSVSNIVVTAAGAVDVSGLRWVPIPNVQAGMNIRVLMEKIDTISTLGAVMDLGALWTPERAPNLTVALVGQNLGPAVKGDNVPITFRGGAAYHFMQRSLVIALDLYKPVDNFFRISGGAELWYKGLLAIRGGYGLYGFQGKADLNEFGSGALGGLSLGAGFLYRIVRVDYAFASLGFFGATHRLSLTVSF